MEQNLHATVGVVITNRERNLFYFQQKDETYFIKPFRMKYSIFGGKIEDGEIEDYTLRRELIEELNKEVAELVYNKSNKVLDCFFEGLLAKNAKITLYESILSTNELIKISRLPIKEGKTLCLTRIKHCENILK
jgi:8-oxo-dGTP pyrophosphatase MutT (NUDIX family)